MSKAHSAESKERKSERTVEREKKKAGAIKQSHSERKCGNGGWEEKIFAPEL